MINNHNLDKKENRFLTTVIDKLINNGVNAHTVEEARISVIEHVTEAKSRNEDPLEQLGDPEEFANEYIKISKSKKGRKMSFLSILFMSIIIAGFTILLYNLILNI